MAVVEEVHYGDIGTIFRVTFYDGSTLLDVSSALSKKIIFQKADGSVVEKDAVFTTDGTDGKIEYISIANDLNVTGKWKLQAFIQLPSGQWKSNIVAFKVYTNL